MGYITYNIFLNKYRDYPLTWFLRKYTEWKFINIRLICLKLVSKYAFTQFEDKRPFGRIFLRPL